jgi:hypothetical protein
VAVVWPAAGLSAGVLIKVGPVARIPVVVGTIAATIVDDVSGDRNIRSAIIFGVCNAGDAVLVASLVEPMFPSPFKLDTLSRVIAWLLWRSWRAQYLELAARWAFCFSTVRRDLH